MTKPLTSAELDMLQACAITAQQTAPAMLMVWPSEVLALVTEVRHLRDLTERLMEALRRPVGWPTTEAAMIEHARRAGAALEALDGLRAHITARDAYTLTVQVNGKFVSAAGETKWVQQNCGELYDLLAWLVRTEREEVQQ